MRERQECARIWKGLERGKRKERSGKKKKERRKGKNGRDVGKGEKKGRGKERRGRGREVKCVKKNLHHNFSFL